MGRGFRGPSCISRLSGSESETGRGGNERQRKGETRFGPGGIEKGISAVNHGGVVDGSDSRSKDQRIYFQSYRSMNCRRPGGGRLLFSSENRGRYRAQIRRAMAPQEQGRGWDTGRGGGGRNGATGDGIALGVKHVLHVERTVGGPCSGLLTEL